MTFLEDLFLIAIWAGVFSAAWSLRSIAASLREIYRLVEIANATDGDPLTGGPS
jgi:hypothetical protein